VSHRQTIVIELAKRVITIQTLVSDYERDKLRLSAKMAVRFAVVLELTADELLGGAGNEWQWTQAQPQGTAPPRTD